MLQPCPLLHAISLLPPEYWALHRVLRPSAGIPLGGTVSRNPPQVVTKKLRLPCIADLAVYQVLHRTGCLRSEALGAISLYLFSPQ